VVSNGHVTDMTSRAPKVLRGSTVGRS